MPAKPLTAEQTEDARRLKRLFLKKQENDKSLTQESLAHACGWKTQSSAQQYLNGQIPLNLPALLKFSAALQADPREISPTLARQLELPERSVDWRVEENVAEYAPPQFQDLIPLISWTTAGLLCENHDPLQPGDAEEWLPCPVPHGPGSFALKLVGTSMFPDYRDGEIVFFDPNLEAVHNDDVVVRTPDNKSTFKRLQKTPDGTFLLALNPDIPDRIIRVPDETHICGVAIFSGIARRR